MSPFSSFLHHPCSGLLINQSIDTKLCLTLTKLTNLTGLTTLGG